MLTIGVLASDGNGLKLACIDNVNFSYRCIAADVDRDGFEEILVSYLEDQTRVLGMWKVVNNNLIETWRAREKVGNYLLTTNAHLASADIDGDGNKEVIIYDGQRLAILRTFPDGTFTMGGQHLGNIEGWQLSLSDVFYVADIDGDGRDEIIAHNGKGLAVFRKRDNDDQFTITGWHWDKIEGWNLAPTDVFYVADIDGDGRDELIAHNGKGFAVFRKCNENDQFTMTGWHWGKIEGWNLAPTDAFHVTDIDGDGRDEIIANNGKALAVFRRGDEGDQLTMTGWHWGSVEGAGGYGNWALPTFILCTGDVNNDNLAEIIVYSGSEIGVLRQTDGALRLVWRDALANYHIRSSPQFFAANLGKDKGKELLFVSSS